MNLMILSRAGVACALSLLLTFSASAQRASQADVQTLADTWARAYNKHDRAALEFDGPDFDRLVADIESDVA